MKVLDGCQEVGTESIRRSGISETVEIESAPKALRGAELADFLHDATIIVAMRERTARSAL